MMLKRSASERACPAHVRAIGIKVLPSVFQRPALRVTGLVTSSSFDNDRNNGYDICSGQSSNYSPASLADEERFGRRWDPEASHHSESRSFDELELNELTESERDFKIDSQINRAGQLIEQDRKLQERIGLDEILRVCIDYEKQTQLEKGVKERNRSSPRLVVVTKIKTNGSLTSASAHVRRCAEISKQQNGGNLISTQLNTEDVMLQDASVFDKTSPVCDDYTDNTQCSFESDDKCSTDRASSFYENAQNGEVVKPFQLDASSYGSFGTVENDAEVLRRQPSPLKPGTIGHSSKSACNRVPSSEAGADEIHQNPKLDLSKLNEEITKSAEQLEKIKHQLEEMEKMEEKLLRKLEHEMKDLDSESMEEMASLCLEQDRITVIKEQQVELLLEAAKEQEEFQQQIQSERQKLEKLEEHCRLSRKRLKDSNNLEEQTDLRLEAKRDRDAAELQQRYFDDIEFSLLELETKREEEREPLKKKLATELDLLVNLKSQREESLCKIEQRKLEIERQMKEELSDLEKECHQLINRFKKERLVYIALVEQMNKCVAVSGCYSDPCRIPLTSCLQNGDCCRNPFFFSQSDVNEDLCRTPQLRIRKMQTLLGREQQDSGNSSALPPGDSTNVSSASEQGPSEGQSEEGSQLSPFSNVFSSGSEDSSFNSLDELLHRDTSRFEVNGQSQNPKLNEEKETEQNSTQGNRGVSRSLSEPISKRMELTCSIFPLALTDEEIQYRGNRNQPTQARPLTRYLPVRDKNLNLRSFVESSGHCLDETSQVFVTQSTCSGYLRKQGGKFRTWHKRWFSFDRDRRCLMCYSDRTEAKLRRSIYFQTIVDVFVDHLKTVLSPNPKLTFCLKTLDRKFYLVAPTGEAMRIWIDVLFTGAEGYQEFW